jgi:hypothetical protein
MSPQKFFVGLLGIVGKYWELLGISTTYAESFITHSSPTASRANYYQPSTIPIHYQLPGHAPVNHAGASKRLRLQAKRNCPRKHAAFQRAPRPTGMARACLLFNALTFLTLQRFNAAPAQPVGATQIRRSTARSGFDYVKDRSVAEQQYRIALRCQTFY